MVFALQLTSRHSSNALRPIPARQFPASSGLLLSQLAGDTVGFIPCISAIRHLCVAPETYTSMLQLGRGGLVKWMLVVRVLARRLWRDRGGAALIEYTLLIGLITVTVLGTVIAAGSWANGIWVNFLSSLGP